LERHAQCKKWLPALCAAWAAPFCLLLVPGTKENAIRHLRPDATYNYKTLPQDVKDAKAYWVEKGSGKRSVSQAFCAGSEFGGFRRARWVAGMIGSTFECTFFGAPDQNGWIPAGWAWHKAESHH